MWGHGHFHEMDHVHTRSTSETDFKKDIKISYLNCNSYCITGNRA